MSCSGEGRQIHSTLPNSQGGHTPSGLSAVLASSAGSVVFNLSYTAYISVSLLLGCTAVEDLCCSVLRGATVSSVGCCAVVGCNDADPDTRPGWPESQVAVSAANPDPDDHVCSTMFKATEMQMCVSRLMMPAVHAPQHVLMLHPAIQLQDQRQTSQCWYRCHVPLVQEANAFACPRLEILQSWRFKLYLQKRISKLRLLQAATAGSTTCVV